MSSRSINPIAIRLPPGADLRAEISAIAARKNVSAGCVLTAVGSLSRARIRFAGRPEYAEIVRDLEIVSLVGTISPDGSHLHLTISDDKGMTIGGHMGDGCIVRTTAEVVIGELPGVTFWRRPDEQTGYDELSIEKQATIVDRLNRPDISTIAPNTRRDSDANLPAHSR